MTFLSGRFTDYEGVLREFELRLEDAHGEKVIRLYIKAGDGTWIKR